MRICLLSVIIGLMFHARLSQAFDVMPTTAPATSTSTTKSDRVLPMAVIVNGSDGGVWLLVEHDGILYATSDAFEEWRLALNADTAPVDFKGQQFFPLNAIPGYRGKIDFANQSVELQFSPQAFAGTRLANEKIKRPEVSPVLPSLQISYDLNYSQSHQSASTSTQDLSALTEVAYSSNAGVLTSSAIGRNLTSDKLSGTPSQWLRLETTLTKNFPDGDQTLRVGDANTRVGLLGRNVYFGGVQFGTNFGLTPGYVHQPIPVLSGFSSAPSTVQLYVNDVLRQVSNVPTGPFAIENFPALTASGDAKIVVTDQLGRQTVYQQSFFTNSQLLTSGLNDWSVEVGKIRNNLGSTDSNYGDTFASGYLRHGLNDRVTLEGRAVAAKSLDLMELGVVTTLPFQLLGRAALAGSHDKSLGNGTQRLLGVERQSLRFAGSLEVQQASTNFRDLGDQLTNATAERQIAGNLSYTSAASRTLGLGYVNIKNFGLPAVTTLSANYSLHLYKSANLTIIASQARGGGVSRNTIGATLYMFFGGNKSGSAYINDSGNTQDAYATYIQSPDQNNPLGWRVLAGELQNKSHEEAGVNYLGPHGNFNADVSTSPDQTALRLGASGGLVFTANHLFVTPRLTNSFAVAEVKDYADVGVGIGSTMLTKTDAKGIALIPNLTAYQSNSIRLNAEDLPLSAELDSIERDVVPAWRSGARVVFPVRGGRGALIKIELEGGEPAPAGAIVHIIDDKQEFYVARRGEAFVTGLKASSRLQLRWKEQQCEFDVNLPPEKSDDVPRVGPLLCKGVAR